MKGRVLLYNHNNELLRNMAYFTPAHRRKIVNKWKGEYPQFEDFYIQIQPTYNCSRVRIVDGRNIGSTDTF